MNDFTKIMIAALLAMVVVAWAAPSEARNRHFRTGNGRHSVRGHKFLGFHGKRGNHHLHRKHRFYHRKHHLKSHYSLRHRQFREGHRLRIHPHEGYRLPLHGHRLKSKYR